MVTPGLPYWLAPETLGGVSPTDPAESLKRSIAEARAAKADAIVVMGHMGWRNDDDFANPVREILKANEGVDVFLAGHTHQDKPSWELGGVLCSQASYYGINCGRVDLTFDLESRKLVQRRAFTLLMDKRFDLDPVVMELAQPDLKKADEQMARKLGVATRVIAGNGRGQPSRPSSSASFSARRSSGTTLRSMAFSTAPSAPATFRRAKSASPTVGKCSLMKTCSPSPKSAPRS